MFNEIGQVPARGIAILTSIVPTLSPITKRIISVFFRTLGKTLLYTSMGVMPFLTITNPLASVTMKGIASVGIVASGILVIQCAVAGVWEILKLRKQRKHIQTINFIVQKLESQTNRSCASHLKAAAAKYELKKYDDLTSLDELSKQLNSVYYTFNAQNNFYKDKIDEIQEGIKIFEEFLKKSEKKLSECQSDKSIHNKLRALKLKIEVEKSLKSKYQIELNEILLEAIPPLLPV